MAVDVVAYLQAAGEKFNQLGVVYINLPLLKKAYPPANTAEEAAAMVCISAGFTDLVGIDIRYVTKGDQVQVYNHTKLGNTAAFWRCAARLYIKR